MKIPLKTLHLESHIAFGGETKRLFSSEHGISIAMHTDKGVVTISMPGRSARIIPMSAISWCEPEKPSDLEAMPEDGEMPEAKPQDGHGEVVIFPPKRGRPKKS